MKKQELHDFLIGMASAGMEAMVARCGEFPQRAVIVDLKMNLHGLEIPGEPLHGIAMAAVLREFARHIGGADVITVQADARLRVTTKPEWDAKPKGYSIARDETNPECLITSGRSHEHMAIVICRYKRTNRAGRGDLIEFERETPEIEPVDRMNAFMIPNIWEPTN